MHFFLEENVYPTKKRGKRPFVYYFLPRIVSVFCYLFVKKLFQKNIVTSELIFQPKNGDFDVLTMLQRRDAKMLIFFWRSVKHTYYLTSLNFFRYFNKSSFLLTQSSLITNLPVWKFFQRQGPDEKKNDTQIRVVNRLYFSTCTHFMANFRNSLHLLFYNFFL